MKTNASSASTNNARLFGGTLNASGQALLRFVLRDGASISIALDRDELAKLQAAVKSLLAQSPEHGLPAKQSGKEPTS